MTLRDRLLAWYDHDHRDLPWRRDPTPWAVWVSEVMLQQTRVESVLPYFARFMARWPTPAALAAAPLDELLAAWAGLGYYARARNLHRAAQQVVARHGGEVPGEPDAFGALAGVGRYTCGAVQSIAFGHPVPVLDGNVERVLCRLDRVTEDPRAPAVRRALWDRAAALADGPRPGDLNQALMELGARVCTPRAPRCLLCPLLGDCAAHRAGEAEALPRKAPRAPRRAVNLVAGLVRTPDHRVWLGRRPAEGLLGGLWELPAVEAADPSPAALRALGLAVIAEGGPTTVRHAFTHLEWTLHVWPALGQPTGYEEVSAFPVHELGSVALTGPTLKALRACGVPVPHRRGAGRR